MTADPPDTAVATEWLRLTSYFGERDRSGSGLVADALADLYAGHEALRSVVWRGRHGFGVAHDLRAADVEVLSLELPVVSTVIDSRERIERLLPAVLDALPAGLVTLERLRLLPAGPEPAQVAAALAGLELAAGLGEAVKLTVQLTRGDRTATGIPAYRAVVGALRAQGAAGATVLLGVDGTIGGLRRRATFFSRNRQVPLTVQSIGSPEAITAAVLAIGVLAPGAVMTLERVRVCKRDGVALGRPAVLADRDPAGTERWQKLSLYGALDDRHEGRPVHAELLRLVREAGGMGATTVQGIWGFHGDGRPHGDRLVQLVRRVPLVTTIIDRPSRIAQLFDLADRLTPTTGLVTSELVPVRRPTTARGPHQAVVLADVSGR